MAGERRATWLRLRPFEWLDGAWYLWVAHCNQTGEQNPCENEAQFVHMVRREIPGVDFRAIDGWLALVGSQLRGP